MVTTEGDKDRLRLTNLKKLAQFFSRCVIRNVAPLSKLPVLIGLHYVIILAECANQ